MLAGAMVAALVAVASTPTPTNAAPAEVLFITSNAAQLPSGDVPAHAEIVDMGFDVVLGDDDTVTAADAATASLIVISTSVATTKIGSEFTDTATPVVTWEPSLFDDLGMTDFGGAHRGEVSGQTRVNFVDADHPIADGRSGLEVVARKSSNFSFGRPSDAASVVALIAGSGTRAAVFTYESGDSMVNGVAPARRVGLFPSFGTPRLWNDSGREIFRNAVQWATGEGTITNRAPVVDAGPDQTILLGESADISGSVSDDGLPEPASLTTAWTASAGADVATPGSADSTVDFDSAGTFELTLTADDGELVSVDTLTITVRDPAATSLALLVIGRDVPGAQDRPVLDRLLALGYEVTVVDDNDVDAADAAGFDVTLISASVAASAVDRAFADSTVPLMVWERLIYDELGFTRFGSGNGNSSQKSLTIDAPDHPAAAGLIGAPQVYSRFDRTSWSRPEGDATIIATLANSSTKAAIFGYESGAQMSAGHTAPARRLGFFLGTVRPERLTEAGWDLFDASVAWVADTPAAPTGHTVDAGTDASTAVGDVLTLAGDTSAGIAATSAWSGPAGASFADSTALTTGVTFDSVGTYTLTLTVDDEGEQRSDSVDITVGPNPLTAVLDASRTTGVAPLAIDFDATSSSDTGGAVVTSDWDFGDGFTASGSLTSHVFTEPGSYTVTLTVTDTAGLTDTATVSVVAVPAASTGGRVDVGLTALYDFAGGASTVADVSGVGAPLDLTIADAAATTWLTGGGLRLTAPTVVVSAGPASKVNNAFISASEFTVEAWIDPLVALPNEPGRIVSIAPSDETRNMALSQGFIGEAGDRIEGRIVTQHSNSQGFPAAESAPGTLGADLSHVVLTRTADGMESIWIDGQLADQARVGGDLSPWNTTYPLALGADPDGSRPWLGDYHLVALYDRALTQLEVCQNLAAGPGRAVFAANVAPSSCLAIDAPTGPAPHTVNVSAPGAHDVDGTVTNYRWDFGDGTVITNGGDSASHVYATGDYTLELTVTDDDGASSTTSTQVVVRNTPNLAPRPDGFDDSFGWRASGGLFELDSFQRAEDIMGRQIPWTTQFTDKNGKFAMESNTDSLFTNGSSTLPGLADQMSLSLTVPLAFGNAKPRNNAGRATIRQSLIDTAAGAHDASYTTVAQNLVDGGYPDAVIRLAHEFDGDWFPYSSRTNEAEFIAAWQHVHGIFAAVSPGFRFEWNTSRGGWPTWSQPAYPGDDYVDVISMDIYWRLTAGQDSWDQGRWNNGFRNKLNSQLAFAIAHGKPVAVPEWGLLGGDEPRFIEAMYSWFAALPADGPGSLVYQAYFDAGKSREHLADHPMSQQTFIDLFMS